MDIAELFKDKSDEQISAFAYNMGRVVEDVIKGKVGDIQDENTLLKGKIMEFRSLISVLSLVKVYDAHFNIEQL